MTDNNELVDFLSNDLFIGKILRDEIQIADNDFYV